MIAEQILCCIQIRIVDGVLEQLLRVELSDGDDKIEVDEWRTVGVLPTIAESFTSSLKLRRRIRPRDVDWDGVDWNKPNLDLSYQLGISVSSVAKTRTAMGKQIYKRMTKDNRLKITPEMIDGVDWAKQRDAEIARKWDVSRERVRQIRMKYGFEKERRPDVVVEALKWIEDNKASLIGKSAKEVISSMPFPELGRDRRRTLIKQSGIEVEWSYNERPVIRNGEALNWDIPNKWLSVIYNLNVQTFALYRSKNCLGRARWHLSGYGAKTASDEDFISTLNAEIEKAISHGVKVDEDKIKEELRITRERYESIIKKTNQART